MLYFGLIVLYIRNPIFLFSDFLSLQVVHLAVADNEQFSVAKDLHGFGIGIGLRIGERGGRNLQTAGTHAPYPTGVCRAAATPVPEKALQRYNFIFEFANEKCIFFQKSAILHLFGTFRRTRRRKM